MSDFKGTVLEVKGKKAVVMSNLCDFVTVKRQPQMYVGQQLSFSKKDLYNSAGNHLKYIALAASIFIVFFSCFIYYQFFIPSTVFAYIDVDINPSIEFAIDKNSRVVEVKPLNSDAQDLLDSMKLKGMPVRQAIAKIVKKSEQQGYIKPGIENAVLVSASVEEEKDADSEDAESKLLDDILSELGSSQLDLLEANVKLEVIKVSCEERNQAVRNEISMGRYELYNKIKDQDKDTNITVQQAKDTHLSDMLEKAKVNALDKGNAEKKDVNDNKVKNTDDSKKEKSNSNSENAENIGDSGSTSTDNAQDKDKKAKKQSLMSDDTQTDIEGADVDDKNPVASISDSGEKHSEGDNEKKQNNKGNDVSSLIKKDDESKVDASKEMKEKKDNSNKNNSK